jgi:phospholipase/carboxylesterase
MNLSYQHVFKAGTDPLAPPLLLLHGTGGDENDLLPLGQDLSPGSALLSPRGDVLEHGMPRFFRRFAEGVFDLTDVEKRTHALADFIAEAAEHYHIDTRKLLAVGYSNGANIASSLLLLRPEALAGAALFRPMVVLEPKQSPILSGKRILISSGLQDPIVPPDHPSRLAGQFRKAGAEVTLHSHAAGHGLTRADFTAAKKLISPG